MQKLLLVLFLATVPFLSLRAQVSFESAYQNHPLVPSGLLEAVAWINTRMTHLKDQQPSCTGYPQAYGIMGLHDNGGDYFLKNGLLVEQLSGISVEDQKASAENQIEAYAAAVEALLIQQGATAHVQGITIRSILQYLSEIPDSGMVNLMARDMQVMEVMRFMNNTTQASQFGFTPHTFDLPSIFGSGNYTLLTGKKITVSDQGISNESGASYTVNANASFDYAPALWDTAATCNYSSRDTITVKAITIHTVQGSYYGAISWAQNCNANVSYHYVIRSSDGQITQMVLEADKAWHVGSENSYTIGYEHEGYVDNNIWYTTAMYEASAALSRDVVNSGYGIPALRTYYNESSSSTQPMGMCTRIKGHQHYPNQTHTDPGIYWDWERYYKLINNAPVFDTIATTSGSLYDSGGAGGDYTDDERKFWLIQPANTASITLNFTTFELENWYDNLFIYDGDSTDAPLIGKYTGTNSPGSVTSSGGSILIEFRSDCATAAPGWSIDFTTVPADVTPPTTSIVVGNIWQTQDFTVNFTDVDADSYIKERYYLVAEKQPTENGPHATGSFGFAHETFDDNAGNWLPVTGTYSLQNNSYAFSDTNEQNSNTYMLVAQDATTEYLFEWTQTFTGTAQNQRAGLHFFCDNPNLSNRGNSYFVYLRANDDKVQIYSVDNDVYTLQVNNPLTIDEGTAYLCRVQYDPVSGWIRAFVDDVLIAEWQDPSPLQSGISISLRTGGCEAAFDDVHVYRSRSTQETITTGTSGMMSIESEGAVPTGFVYSLVTDSVDLWSSVDTEQYLLDFSNPQIVFLNDGNASDIDTFTTPTIEANWDAIDIHSDIQEYEIAVGTLPMLDDVVAWNSNGLSETFSHVLSSPIYNQVYHISVRVTNGAGLDETFVSDGQKYIDDLGLEHIDWTHVTVYPNPTNDVLRIDGLNGTFNAMLYDATGKLCMSAEIEGNTPVSIAHLAAGSYQLVLQFGQEFIVRSVQKL